MQIQGLQVILRLHLSVFVKLVHITMQIQGLQVILRLHLSVFVKLVHITMQIQGLQVIHKLTLRPDYDEHVIGITVILKSGVKATYIKMGLIYWAGALVGKLQSKMTTFFNF